MKNKKNVFIVAGSLMALALVAIVLFVIFGGVFSNSDTYLQSLGLNEIEIGFVEDLLKKENSDITSEDIDGVKNITLVGEKLYKNIATVDYNSLNYKVNGREYEYGEAFSAEELSALRIFVNTENIYIFYQPQLRDLSFVGEFSNLKTIDVLATNVKDFTFISKLSKLTRVNIDASPVEKIGFHPDNGIREMFLKNGRISDFSMFDNLNAQCRNFRLEYNKVPIANLDKISRFESIEYLAIGAPEMKLDFFAEFRSKPQIIWLSESKEMDLNYLHGLGKYVTEIIITNVDGIDLTPLDKMEALERISLMNVSNITRGEKTAEDSEYLVAEMKVTFNFLSWFEYDN